MKPGDWVKVDCIDSPFNLDYGEVIRVNGDRLDVELEHTPGAAYQFAEDELHYCAGLTTYYRLMKLRDRPDDFKTVADEMMQEYLDSIEDPERRRKAEQINWTIQAKLRGVPSSQRYNKMVEIFWEGFREFQAAIGGGNNE